MKCGRPDEVKRRMCSDNFHTIPPSQSDSFHSISGVLDYNRVPFESTSFTKSVSEVPLPQSSEINISRVVKAGATFRLT